MIEFLKKLFGWKTKYQLEDVFTASATTVNYLSRPPIESKLIRNIGNKAKQIVVFGHSGGGKTTLLENVKKNKYLNVLESYCMNITTVDQLVLNAFDQLDVFYSNEKTDSETSKLIGKYKAEYLGNSAEVGSELGSTSSNKRTRAVDIQLTAQRLSDFLGKSGMIWLIDDFHKLDKEEKTTFSQMLKVFSTQSKKYPKLKIICVGAERSAREVIDYDVEMNDRIAEIYVPLLTDHEIRDIVENGFQLLNVKASSDLKTEIVKYSNNLATVAHNLCNHLCYELNILETQKREVTITKEHLKPALKAYVEEKADSYKQTMDKAIKQQRKSKYNNGELILKAFLKLNSSDVSHAELLTQIQKSEPEYRASNLTTYLKHLCSDKCDEILSYDEDSNKFSIRNPFMYGYLQMVFENEEKAIGKSNDDDSNQYTKLKLNKEMLDLLIKLSTIAISGR